MAAVAPKLPKLPNAVNRFGWVKFHPKPLTPEAMARVMARHRYIVPNVAALHLTYMRRGPGMSGARHFRWEALPPLQHHNAGLVATVHVVEPDQPAEEPTLKVTLKNGATESIAIKAMRDAAIMEKLYAIDGSTDVERDPFDSEESLLMLKH